MTTTDAVKLMRGKPGSTITLTLSRKDSSQPVVVKMQRAIIKVQSVRSKLVAPDYAYIRVIQFQEPTTDLVGKAIRDLSKANNTPLKGIILDLRDDPGGLLNGAVGVAAAFLPDNSPVVSTKGRDGKKGMELKATRTDYLLDSRTKDPLAGLPAESKTVPVTVLINSGSASASEIVAGALQDHKRAVIVGTQSFGKGSVQTLIPLSNGGGVKITTALYYTPNDRSIQAKGIVPDVVVKDKTRTYETREADLTGHLTNPKGGTEVKGSIGDKSNAAADTTVKPVKQLTLEEEIERRRNPTPENDEQLAKALQLLKDPTAWKQSIGLSFKNEKAAKTDSSDKK
jgi:carboxyl-terminal processing protease